MLRLNALIASNPRLYPVRECITLLFKKKKKKKILHVFCFLDQPNTEDLEGLESKGTDVGRRSEEESQRTSTAVEGPHLHSFGAQTLKKSPVSGVHTETFPHRNGPEPPDASPDLLVPACLWEPQGDSPKFITLLAPLATGSSHVSQTSSGVRKSIHVNTDLSAGREQACVHRPKPDRIHVKPSLEGEALTHIKDTTKNAPPEGQLDLDIARGSFTERKASVEDVHALRRHLSSLAAVPGDRFVISEEKRLAVFTLDIDDLFVSSPLPSVPSLKPEKRGKADTMSHKTHKSATESKARPKKDKPVVHQGGSQTPKKEDQSSHHLSAQQVCKQQEGPMVPKEKCSSKSAPARCEDREVKPVAENTEKASNKSHGKKKKKHAQHAAGTKGGGEALADAENGAKPKTTKGRVDMFEAKLNLRAGNAQKDSDHSCHAEKKSIKPEAKISKEQPSHHTGPKDQQPKGFTSPLNDEIKRRRLSGDKFGKMVSVLEPKLPKPAPPHQEKREETEAEGGAPQKAHSQVVKEKTASQEGKKHIQPFSRTSCDCSPARRSLTLG